MAGTWLARGRPAPIKPPSAGAALNSARVQDQEEYKMNAKALIPLLAVYLSVSYAAEFGSTEQEAMVVTPDQPTELPTSPPASETVVTAESQTMVNSALQVAAALDFPDVSLVSGYDRESYTSLVDHLADASGELFDIAVFEGIGKLRKVLGSEERGFGSSLETLAGNFEGDAEAFERVLNLANDRLQALEIVKDTLRKIVVTLEANPLRQDHILGHRIACIQEHIDWNIPSAIRDTEQAISIIERAAA